MGVEEGLRCLVLQSNTTEEFSEERLGVGGKRKSIRRRSKGRKEFSVFSSCLSVI